MSYKQLSLAERQQIYVLKIEQGLSLRAIAQRLERAASTISRELNRNQTNKRYLPDTAHQLSTVRRQDSKRPFLKVSLELLVLIKQALAAFHSPEQLRGRLQLENQNCVSHETIYRMIYTDYEGLGLYKKYLRQDRAKRRKRARSKSKRVQIPGRVDIDERPAVADLKVETGHWGSLEQRPWEGDTVIGANQQGGVVTLVDKCSKYLLAELISNRKATVVRRVCERLLQSVPDGGVKTITFDNGKEFTQHEKLSEAVGAMCYFAKPYHSWERGLNEHTNGMLRQFFPKSTNFWTVKAEELKRAVDLLNDRPRKSLGYRTPREVFWG